MRAPGESRSAWPLSVMTGWDWTFITARIADFGNCLMVGWPSLNWARAAVVIKQAIAASSTKALVKKWIKSVLQRFMASIQRLTNDLVVKGEITTEEPSNTQHRLIVADSKGVFCQKDAVIGLMCRTLVLHLSSYFTQSGPITGRLVRWIRPWQGAVMTVHDGWVNW